MNKNLKGILLMGLSAILMLGVGVANAKTVNASGLKTTRNRVVKVDKRLPKVRINRHQKVVNKKVNYKAPVARRVSHKLINKKARKSYRKHTVKPVSCYALTKTYWKMALRLHHTDFTFEPFWADRQLNSQILSKSYVKNALRENSYVGLSPQDLYASAKYASLNAKSNRKDRNYIHKWLHAKGRKNAKARRRARIMKADYQLDWDVLKENLQEQGYTLK